MACKVQLLCSVLDGVDVKLASVVAVLDVAATAVM